MKCAAGSGEVLFQVGCSWEYVAWLQASLDAHLTSFLHKHKGKKGFLKKTRLIQLSYVCGEGSVCLSAPAVFYLPVTFEPVGQFYANQMEGQRFQKYSDPMSFVKNSA